MKSCKIEKTKSLSVVCMGQEVPYDHPRIYLAVNPETKEVTCPYCSKKFILE
ncbi:MAG: zinc-finger domain-containing protein [Rickettsiaceae bacterium]|jgi:uncharacterized Zn-finger protein|nr:zinc-finger domain-containing protein [Candidatus Megaera polyxenophila]MBP9778029.1 zinc-finger domain-containing protein [Rickettsiaceae bacterium]MBU6183703.1 zinc-finger domain-containing protein [Rickettsiales bacterium]NBU53231.1 zinc-finger domain-containing protein [Alphaproteobacteria bacterium]UCM94401.1 MAG: zinc-finger domain-containing protein [Candidatus Megaira endosymbiont of Mesostigma viride]HJK85240.1 zinc-finger domain-containing protein [Candidatus Megaera endosymbiont 